MLKKLCPKFQANSILELDLDKLSSMGIKAVIFDLDNTLVEWHQDQLNPEVIELIERFKQKGFKLCILSNALEYRVEAVAKLLDIPYVSQAIKPRKSPFIKALEILGTAPENTAVVGDQLFTDILGGNRMQLYTIWTPPLSDTEFFSTRAVRKLERLVVKRFRKKGILK
ncbi:MAG TPA: YqeG family HAD IIIA-type phosphatase [Bacillota bacterium]|jgi:HAD superfamily phosphatase (TIGR01668 family)|nr:YqeG family HAD IIIA-type phosphatase [Bacillota bacterium]HOL10654.1 YqeG family HAD IIIA-type phosphatase [Bacillota bacterium]HPO98057.1 YqeG family HAD IIIA-type phosphatase [Bacillota bacterium]